MIILLRSLPDQCQVNKKELQDEFLVSTYEGLPNLLLVYSFTYLHILTRFPTGLESLYRLGMILLVLARYYLELGVSRVQLWIMSM